MLKINTCHVCASKDLTRMDFLVARKLPLWHCNQCGLGFVDMSGTGEADDYVDEYWDDVNQKIYAQEKVINELRQKYLFYFNQIKKTPNKKYLDVGSGVGVCVDTARQFGFDAMGVEPSSTGVMLARNTYNVNVVNDILHNDNDLPHDFSVLTLWDVIEHVTKPEDLIDACNKHLLDKGYLILETPDEGAFARKIVRFLSGISSSLDFRKNMYYRAHRYYFTHAAMKKLLERCGFDEITFYRERSMYEKAKMKLDLYYLEVPVAVKTVRKTAFWFMKKLPFAKNKMVVIARKAPVSRDN